MAGSRADTARLIASLELQDKFSGTTSKFNKAMAGIDTRLAKTEGRARKAGQQIGTGIKAGLAIATVAIAGLATQVFAGLSSLAKLEDATAQTNAVLASTKGVAGQTADSIRTLAERMENLNATMDDKVIQSGENLLLTFTNIRKEAFEPALLAALDLNEAMGGGEGGLEKTIIQVGKALNDPAKGFTALRRVGVSFTDAQVKQIKALQKSGDLLGAQTIILKELSTEFGGSFAAKGKGATATIAGIGDAVEDLQKGLASALFPTINKLLPRVREFLANPAFLKGVTDLGDKINSLFSDENVAKGANVIKGVFTTIQQLMPAIQSGAEITGKLITTAVSAFRSLPPEIQALAVTGLAINKLTGGLVTNIAGGLISAVISSFRGLMNVNAAVVNVNGGVGGVPGVIPGGAGKLGAVASIISKVTIVGIAAGVAYELGGAWLQVAERRALGQGLQKGGLPKDFQTKIVDADRAMMRAAIDNSNALKTNTAAILNNTTTLADQQSAVSADREARGLKGHRGIGTGSKSFDPRIGFLAGNAAGSKDVAVAEALAVGFERSGTKASDIWRSLPEQLRVIKALQADQRQLVDKGDTKAAAKIGGYVDRLKTDLAKKQEAAASKIAGAVDKTTAAVAASLGAFTVTVASSPIYINGRLFEASVNRTTSTVKSGFGGQ